jgi:hypothetical protein
MSHSGYGKGCFGSWDVTAPRNYKPLIAFVLIDELIFLAGVPLAGRLGVQMTFTILLWAVTILTAMILWRMKLFRNAGFRAWVVVVASLTVEHLL